MKQIEKHRLKELIYQDIKTYPNSSISEINDRIGKEIASRKIKSMIDNMTSNKEIEAIGQNRWREYSINKQGVK
ncbi:MAG TPA: hypothetical protein DD381_03435 [Lentisphaeria bacterium]|nr:MAG: hypothetical protein A2X47_02815 [Lentisphaerae bacterium GWF2_38_69]HBM15385.1 hypothetical protein [Lentisphaeria bacterium]